MNSKPWHDHVPLRCLLLLFTSTSTRLAHGQSETVQLAPLVSVATRTPADVRTLGSAVELITPADLARQQLSTFAAALGDSPGIPSFTNGAPGSNDSIFTRGANSDQTLILVDGIRLNDANTDYAVTLGGARLGATDSIEIVRGPQSTLYGSGAAGGVVSLRARKGTGAPSSDASIEAGSFSSLAGAVNAEGERGTWAWSVSASAAHTANPRPNNTFDSANLVLRVDRDVSAAVATGATLRAFEGRFGDPGDIYTNDRYARETERNILGTVFTDLKLAKEWTAHITLGGQNRRYVSFDQLPGVFTSTTTLRNTREVIDAQTSFTGITSHSVTAGITSESESTRNDGFGNIDRRQFLFAAFAEDEWHPISSLYLTGGVRYDDFDTIGSATTGRGTVAWLSPSRSIKLRASYGTGFNTPSFLELYGVATGYSGNPRLRPEHSRGGDAGIDWYLPDALGSFSATWFRNDYRDLIVYDFTAYPGTTANIGRARTDGVEIEAKFDVFSRIQVRANYTYLNANNVSDGTRLLRRPRNSAGADVWRDFGAGWSAGLGVKWVSNREDVDAKTFATVADPQYSVVRMYTEWRANSRLTLQARVENLLNKHYQPVNGYPARGRGAFGEIHWKL